MTLHATAYPVPELPMVFEISYLAGVSGELCCWIMYNEQFPLLQILSFLLYIHCTVAMTSKHKIIQDSVVQIITPIVTCVLAQTCSDMQ